MRKLKFFAIVFLSAVLMIGLCACGGHNGVPESHSVVVTYYFNGGTMEGYSADKFKSLTVQYKSGSVIAEPGVSSNGLPKVTRLGYSVGGWYYAETDNEGNVLPDEDGNPQPSKRKFNFKTDRVEKDITLVAVWSGKIRVYFENLYLMEGIQYKKDYENGDDFVNPGLLNSAVSGGEKAVLGYYWSYDAATNTYSDPIDFTAGLTFDDLNARLGTNPEKEGDYSVLRVYAKLAD